MKKYLLSEADRRELVTALARQRTSPPQRNIARPPDSSVQEGDTYWVIPPCEQGLPAAEMVEGVPASVGVQACLYRHSWRNSELEAMLGPTGLPLRVPVYNYFLRAENNLTQVYKQKDGTWTNARPDAYDVVVENRADSTATVTTQIVQNSTLDPRCEGECRWVADGNGVWQGPTGGCTNGTSTTATGTATTAAPTTTGYPGSGGGGSYSTALPNLVTPSPCNASHCNLICGPVTGTTGTGTTLYPSYILYQSTATATGTGTTGCPAGCSCYGLGYPCAVNGDEVVSDCMGAAPVWTSTTTLDPYGAPCDLAEALFDAPIGNIYRAAVAAGVAEPWIVCNDCDTYTVPLFPLGGEEFMYSGRPDLVTVYESMCVESPCSIEVAPEEAGRAVFLAYSYEKQLFRWTGAGQYLERGDGKFRANWFACTPCTGRPETPPPYWIYDSVTLNADQGVRYDEAAGVYVFEVNCTEGIDCAACGRAPYVFPTTTTSSPSTGTTATPTTGTGTTGSTTTSAPTTTTATPCSCQRPDYCGYPGECVDTVCSVGGSALPRNDNLACFPDSTTPAPYTTGAGTTLAPTQCIDHLGSLCNCGGSPATLPPAGGTCPPGSYLVYPPSPCESPYCVVAPSAPPPTTPPPPPCLGFCIYRSYVANAGPPQVLAWRLESSVCSNISNCYCRAPVGLPGACDELKFTNCVSSANATTRAPCACCYYPVTTTAPTENDCTVGRCRYITDGAGGWIKSIDTCPTGTACPCADAALVGRPPGSDCDAFTLACGQDPPVTTNTGTTINPNGYGCCIEVCSGGSHTFSCVPVADADACVALGGQLSHGDDPDRPCYTYEGDPSCTAGNFNGVCCLPVGLFPCTVTNANNCSLLGGTWRSYASGALCSSGFHTCPHPSCSSTTSTSTSTTGTGTTVTSTTEAPDPYYCGVPIPNPTGYTYCVQSATVPNPLSFHVYSGPHADSVICAAECYTTAPPTTTPEATTTNTPTTTPEATTTSTPTTTPEATTTTTTPTTTPSATTTGTGTTCDPALSACCNDGDCTFAGGCTEITECDCAALGPPFTWVYGFPCID